MACERYREALTELAVGGPVAAGLEAHFASCAGCQEELAALRRTLEAVDDELHALAAAEPSPALVARIRQVAEDPAETDDRAGSTWLWPALAAAALLLVGIFVGRGREPEQRHAVAVASPSPTPAPVTSPHEEVGAAAATVAPSRFVLSPHAPILRRPAARREPEVLLPPGEAAVLVRLVERLQRERLAPPVMATVGRPSPELAELRSIEVGSVYIKPLEIVPLDPAEDSGT
jgi:hypothetical protein